MLERMNFAMKRLVLSLLLSVLFVTAVAAQSTIFIVRHAEKTADGGNDPDLSDLGRARAETLANTLKDAGISAIYATELKRTQQTAAPLAKALRLDTTIVPAKDSAALVAKLRRLPGNFLIVGHGNTIPNLIKAFGIAAPISIGENAYDDLFVIVVEKKPRLICLHYR
jgi:broad specificity phosphatase PhoE